MLAYFFFVGGLVAVVAGAHLLVLGASRLAAGLGIPPLVIGLTVVGFGTSAPELVVSAIAAVQNNPETALGNVTGSNIANVGLILGVAALITPLRPDRNVVRRDGPIMVAVSLVFVLLAFMGDFELWHGIVMLASLAVYLFFNFRWSRNEPAEVVAEVEEFEAATGLLNPSSLPKQIVFIVAGLGLLIAGGQTMVSGAVDIASDLGIPEFVVASTIVALGTSMPELATSVLAAIKREADIAIGNVVGSNVFNLLGVLGVATVIREIPVRGDIQNFDFPIVLAFAVVAVALLALRRQLGRPEGVLLLVGYVGYLAFLLSR